MTFPGPDALGRGLVVGPGADVPPGWEGVDRVVVDEATTGEPETAMRALHRAWSERRRVVVELGIESDLLRQPETERRPPYDVGAA